MDTDVNQQQSLKELLIPDDLSDRFLDSAKTNSKNNIETFGILLGKDTKNNKFSLNLLIPSQTGTANSCMATNPVQIFSEATKRGTKTLGWIHTHPSQTAFLSSIDLHTHLSYQRTLPESVAIVCSAKCKQTVTYSLTSRGMDVITNCKKRGFHDHEQGTPLFRRSRHTVFKDLNFEIVNQN